MVERTDQKARTRASIIDACAELGGRVDEITMEAIADHAGVSRATIYRYFTTVNDVVWQVVNQQLEHESLRSISEGGQTISERVLAAEAIVNDSMFERADSVRLFEISTLQRIIDGVATSDDRPSRRLRFIDEALDPYVEQLGVKRTALLRHALALALGPEALIATLDACRLDPVEAREVIRWTVTALVNQALADSGQGS